jgi:rubredoxin
MELYECPKCGHKYDYPEANPAGFTFWNCPTCGAEDGVHVSPAIEVMFSEEQLAEMEKKKATYCTLKVHYSGVSDVPKFKKYMPELRTVGNREVIEKLSTKGGIVKENISVLDAEHIKAQAESYGLKVEINA